MYVSLGETKIFMASGIVLSLKCKVVIMMMIATCTSTVYFMCSNCTHFKMVSVASRCSTSSQKYPLH